jgi:formylglycine-generating enzyme required for sulfatase activity/DNA-binding NarL/FixJ family response regulator
MNILIVDDEPGLAAGLAAWLKENGWGSPAVATTSDEAVDWVKHNGRLDVLVCDVAIKPEDGFTLRETIQPHLPKMRTIFISGYDLSQHAARMKGCGFLAKPVTGEALDKAIRNLFQPKEPKPFGSADGIAAQTIARSNGQSMPRVVAAFPKVVSSPRIPRLVSASPPANPRPALAQPALAPPAAPKAATSRHKPAAQPGWERELAADELVGKSLENYQVEAKIEEGSKGPVYRAVQIKMGRQVRLYTLDRKLAQDAAEIEKFMSDASVKANVRHPFILAVYEAGESNGLYFYSCEYIPCRSLQWLRESGICLDEASALQAMKVAAEVLAYFSREGIAHHLLSGSCVLIDPNNRTRIANIAAREVLQQFGVGYQMQEVGRMIAGVLPETSQGLGVRQLARSLESGGAEKFPDWDALSQKIAAMEPHAAPEDLAKLEAQQRATTRMVEIAKKRQRRSLIISSAVSLFLLALALGSLWWFVVRPKSGDLRALDKMIKVPGGEFIYQDGEKLSLPTFFIDQHEVTIGQYAGFLRYLEEHPGDTAKFRHPAQPKEKSHVPVGWGDEKLASGIMFGYHARAKKWGRYHEAPLDVNSPVFGVDWFDAYAYAKWKGRRLPTEQEWEKAARGTRGFKYPWGNEPDASKVNSGSDYDADPTKGGDTDGYKRWSPVDAKEGDRSPFGMIGAAGNVSEWTASFDADPQMPNQEIPVIRGGNWKNPDFSTTRRVLRLMDLQADEALGFRTASDVQAREPSK